MRVPQRFDTWIVLVLMLGLGVAEAARFGLSGELGTVKMLVEATLIGVVLTAGYAGWCVACGRAARLIWRVAPKPAAIRVFANVGFLVIMLAAIFVPIHPRTVIVHLPRSVHAPIAPAQARPAGVR